jgi:glycosyltransferase involved in cell wall biosynthesis
MGKSRTNQQIGYLLRSYPRLSQTFILNEILALEQVGVNIQIFAMTNPQEEIVQAQVQQIRAPVHYLSQASWSAFRQVLREHRKVFWQHPAGYLRALFYSLRSREIDRGYTSSGRMACFHMAISLAGFLDQANAESKFCIPHLHAHFAHDPTFTAQLVHMVTGISYSFTAHARDLFQIPRSALADRVKTASTVVTCCQNNLKYLSEVAPGEKAKFSMVYHGVDLERFKPLSHPDPGRDAKPETPLILSVGRLVEKKGFFDLLAALRQVKDQGLRFRAEIYGEGPLHDELNQAIAEHGLSSWVRLAGNCTQQQLLTIFQSATLFVLTPTVTEDGDRDGIPNALVEAMAVSLPVISTVTAGIPEVINHNQNGLLYPPHDIEGITAGIVKLLSDKNMRMRLGKNARSRVIEQFDAFQSASQLKELFSRNLAPSEICELPQPEWSV